MEEKNKQIEERLKKLEAAKETLINESILVDSHLETKIKTLREVLDFLK